MGGRPQDIFIDLAYAFEPVCRAAPRARTCAARQTQRYVHVYVQLLGLGGA